MTTLSPYPPLARSSLPHSWYYAIDTNNTQEHVEVASTVLSQSVATIDRSQNQLIHFCCHCSILAVSLMQGKSLVSKFVSSLWAKKSIIWGFLSSCVLQVQEENLRNRRLSWQDGAQAGEHNLWPHWRFWRFFFCVGNIFSMWETYFGRFFQCGKYLYSLCWCSPMGRGSGGSEWFVRLSHTSLNPRPKYHLQSFLWNENGVSDVELLMTEPSMTTAGLRRVHRTRNSRRARLCWVSSS